MGSDGLKRGNTSQIFFACYTFHMNEIKTSSVHQVLAHSYLTYFVALVLGMIIDYFLPLRVMSSTLISLGPLLLILSTVLIFWSQRTSDRTKHHRRDPENLTARDFCKGPYCYMRSPTHLGLALLVLGFGFLSNSVVIICTALVTFLITRYIFVKHEEKILVTRYGKPYEDYKKIIKF